MVGTIVAKETKPAPGYVIDQTTQTQTVTVNPMDTQTLTFLNEPLCSLTLTKLDSVTGKPVPGTEFTVKDGDGNVLGRYTTGKDGTVVVTGLVPGSTVVVTESRVPSGYVLDTTPKTIIVKNGSNSVSSGGSSGGSGNSSGNGNDLTFENDPKMTLTIHKYIEGTANEPLAGVAFKVVDSSGAPLNPDGGIYYTNNAGEIVLEGLEPGETITAQEIKTVDGYVLDGRPQSIKIEAGKAQNLTFWNKPAGSLIIRKLDKQTGKPLAGVEFEVIYAEGGYKRCTWARNGKKRIVWRCVSRLEFGTKYCHSSPTLDEDRLHRAIVAALNEYGAIRAEVKADVLELAELARSGGEDGGMSLLELRQRLDALTVEQAALVDKILEAKDDSELNAQLETVTAEKQSVLDQIAACQQDEEQQAAQASRQREMEEWLDQQPMCFTEYDDTLTRRFVERITVVDAETIQVKIRDADVVIDGKLC